MQASLALTQADFDLGLISDQVRVTGTTPDDGTVVTTSGNNADLVNEDPTAAPLAGAVAIAVEKRITSAASEQYQTGDVVTYGFTVTNTGKVTLSNVTLTEQSGVTLSGGPVATLPPRDTADEASTGHIDSTSFTASYTLTQDDIERGSFTNRAVVTGSWNGAAVTAEVEVTLEIPKITGLEFDKSVDTSGLSAGAAAPDNHLAYSFAVTNTGNTVLRNVPVRDPLPGLLWDAVQPEGVSTISDGQSINVLNPGQAVMLTAKYRLTQADIDRGQVVNTATAGDPEVISKSDTETVTLQRDLSIALSKVAMSDLATGAGAKAGDTVTWHLRIKNTGTVKLQDFALTDSLAGAVIATTNLPASSAPGMEAPTDAPILVSYTLTQADIESGSLTNSATVIGYVGPPSDSPRPSATDVSGVNYTQDDPSVPDNEPTTQQIAQVTGLTLAKTAAPNSIAEAEVGDDVVYTFVVTNTGNMTLTNVTIVDPLAGLTPDPSWTIGTLAPGETTLTARYKVTADDIIRGSVVNTASVSGEVLL